MADHRLSIGTLQTHARVFVSGSADALQGPLDRHLSEVLPRLVAAAAEPVLNRHDGVVRIRSLEVRLDYTGRLEPEQLARMLAERIAAELTTALSRGTPGTESWPDRAGYLADYVRWRLGIRVGPAWPFAEFLALEVLSPAESVVEILRSAPGVLAVLARPGSAGTAGGPAGAWLTRLDEASCAALLTAVLPPGLPGALSGLDDLLVSRAALDDAGLRSGAERFALQLVLATASRRPESFPADGVPALVATAAVVAGLAWLLERRSRLGRPPLEAPEVRPGLLRDAGDLSGALRGPLHAALDHPGMCRELAVNLSRVAGHRTQQAPTAAKPDPADRTLASPHAGLVLLVPGLVRHRLDRILTAEQRRSVVLKLLSPDRREAAARDPLLAVLFPADPRRSPPPLPPVPAALLASIHPEARGPLAADTTGRDWEAWLLADFAGRLTGLRRSSRSYLVGQFLDTPGWLRSDRSGVKVTLDGPPLAVVLALAGLNGHQGRVPHWDDRSLEIVLTGLWP
jgi:hypothetical protein